jgi:hypothetical protein
VFTLILNKHNPKIYERSTKCMLIGYSKNFKAYQCYHHETCHIIEMYHVWFIESHEANDTPFNIPSPSINMTSTSPGMPPPQSEPTKKCPKCSTQATQKLAESLDIPYTSQLDRMKEQMQSVHDEENDMHAHKPHTTLSSLLKEADEPDEPDEFAFLTVDLGDLNNEPTLEEALKGPEAEKWDAGI